MTYGWDCDEGEPRKDMSFLCKCIAYPLAIIFLIFLCWVIGKVHGL